MGNVSEKDKKKKKKPRTGIDKKHPELLKILSDNDVDYTMYTEEELRCVFDEI